MRDSRSQTRFLHRERKRELRHTLRGSSKPCWPRVQPNPEHPLKDRLIRTALLWRRALLASFTRVKLAWCHWKRSRVGKWQCLFNSGSAHTNVALVVPWLCNVFGLVPSFKDLRLQLYYSLTATCHNKLLCLKITRADCTMTLSRLPADFRLTSPDFPMTTLEFVFLQSTCTVHTLGSRKWRCHGWYLYLSCHKCPSWP